MGLLSAKKMKVSTSAASLEHEVKNGPQMPWLEEADSDSVSTG